MKTYTKTHTSKKAFDTHLARIKSRGGKATVKKGKGAYTIEYSFPDQVVKEWYKIPKNQSSIETTKKYQEQWKQKPKKQYDVLDPDGKSIRKPGVPPFATLKASRDYFEQWKLQHHRSGLWSSKKGLIIANNLKRYCKWIEIK